MSFILIRLKEIHPLWTVELKRVHINVDVIFTDFIP